MKNCTPKLRVKDWAEEDRPREKLLIKGIHSLSDAELLAILIGSGNKGQTVVELSQQILLSAKNDLNELGKYSIDQLTSGFKGIGEVRAITIIAAMELGKRRKVAEINDKTRIMTSEDIYNVFHPMLCDFNHEEFWVLFLNRSNRVIRKMKVSQGGVTETSVDSKIILKEALLCLASSIILCHNHPSGNPHPSVPDDVITKKMKDGAKLLDISILDHVIVCDGCYYSYADEERMN